MSRFTWSFVERFQVIFLVVFLCTFCFWFSEICFYCFHFFVIIKDVVQKFFNNNLLCSSCNKKELFLSSNVFFSSRAFLWQVSSSQLRLSLLFVFTSESSCFFKFCFWQTKVLKLLKSPNRTSIGESGDINCCHLLVLLHTYCPVKLRCHPIECFWYCVPQFCRNHFHC